MFCTPTKEPVLTGSGAMRVHSWRFAGPQEGEAIELPVVQAMSVQTIGAGRLVIEASIDRKHYEPVAEITGRALLALTVPARYLRVHCLEGANTAHLLLVLPR